MIRKREGFTLVELLVVVAIIIILAAILFPIFAKARERAQQTRCLNNMKQLASAIEMYEDDYQGCIMPVSIGNGTPGAEGGANMNLYWGYMWGDIVDPYVKQLKKVNGVMQTAGKTTGQGELYNCPSCPSETADSGSATTWQMGKSYGYNPYLTRVTTSAMVRSPSVTLRITETADYVWDPHKPLPKGTKDPIYKGGSWYCPLPDGKQKGYQLALVAPGWHNGFNTVLWVDGHVSSLPWERVMYTDNYLGTSDPNVWCRLSPKQGFTGEG